MASPDKKPKKPAYLEPNMTEPGSQPITQEANQDSSSSHAIVAQQSQTTVEALHAIGITTADNIDEQNGEQKTQHATGSHQASASISNSTLEPPKPPPIRTRSSRSRCRGRTFDQVLLAYTIANPPPRVIRRSYRSMSEMDCSLGRGYIERLSEPSVVNTVLDPHEFCDVGTYRFCLQCGSDHYF